MANRIGSIIFRYEDAAGAPLSGGKVYFYEAGTTTPKDTYSDEDLVGTNDNPVILNARGEADIFLSGSYKVVVYDANDNLIETQDNVYEHPDIVDVGDPGLEGSGINVNGVIYKTRFRINDIGGAYAAQAVLHRHSTTLQPLLLFARTNSDNATHGAVTAGQSLSSIFATGWTGTHYDLCGESTFSVDAGTVSSTSLPGKWELKLAPNGSTVPADVITAYSTKTVAIGGGLTHLPPTTAGTATAYTVTLGTSGFTTDKVYPVNFHTAGAGTGATINPDGAGAVTLKDRNGNAVIPPVGVARIWYDGTDARLLDIASILTHETATATTSGTSHDYTGIPAWAKKITIPMSLVSTNGTSSPMLQIGDAGGLKTTGYQGSGWTAPNGAVPTATSYTTGFAFRADPSLVANDVTGVGTIVLLDPANYVYAWSFAGSNVNTATGLGGGGVVTLTGLLTQIRLTAVNGTDVFDSGSFNAMYE